MNKNILILLHTITLFTIVAQGAFLSEQELHELAQQKRDPDTGRTFQEIANVNGFFFEKYYVETKDGYILCVFRIPRLSKEEESTVAKKPTVILQHGLLDSADTFIMNDKHLAPAFILAEAGYDVWLGNNRGNKYSRQHKFINADDDPLSFFDYSFDDMGQYDLPALIDFVISKTGHSKVSLIGHSQGTTQTLTAMCDNMPYFKKNLNVFVAWAPVAKLDDCQSDLINAAAKSEFILKVVKQMGINEFLPANDITSAAAVFLCKYLPFTCNIAFSMLSDINPKVNNQKRIPVFMGHFPSGTSIKSLIHYGQLVKSREIRKYEHESKIENMRRYGTPEPPIYKFENIKGLPIALMGGEHDALAHGKDYKWVEEAIKDTLVFSKTYEYGHLSFLVHQTMPHMQDTMDILAKYAPSSDNKIANNLQ